MNERTGAKGALLDEYGRVILELKSLIADISPAELIYKVDENTTDPDCKSIQSIMAHVVNSGFSYSNYIRSAQLAVLEPWEKTTRLSIEDYNDDISDMFVFTIATFDCFSENDLNDPPSNKRILTRWGGNYDFEQIWEHAIVHILRHRRQIEKFKKQFRK